VNSRFADTRASRSLIREPFRLTLDISLRLTTDYRLQQLRRALEPVRVNATWQRRSRDSLAAFYLRRTSSVHQLLLSEGDSLFLNDAQLQALRRADSVYSARVRGVYGSLATFLSTFSGGAASQAALDSANAADKQYWKIFWEQPEIAAEALTPSQVELMPMLKSMKSTTPKERENSQWMFGWPVQLPPTPKPKP
jgi:hypothetical protein